MPSAIQSEFLKRNPTRKLIIGVAIDGSDISDRALETACDFCNAARGDRLVILHVSDSTKTFLPRHLLPKHLERKYVDKAFGMRVTADWACREKAAGSSTCETLMALAHEQHIDLLVVGSFGRKGERVDMLGTVSDYSLREEHSSVCIVRSTAPKRAAGSHKYMFASDGSRAAAMAFCILCNQLVRHGDKILLVTASCEHQPPEGPEFFKDYLQVASSLKVDIETQAWKLDHSQNVADGLLHLAEVKNVDTLVCGISGYSQKKLGSVSDEITHHASCNTIVIKDAYEVLSNTFTSAGAMGLSKAILPSGASKNKIQL